eukprot:gnl/MRDRNA2_/MRDRNA2_531246_c0_seq1.p1 gnl/MRDRNA2_/MRDRNA2_531246_c0~~gnl/MRDRNA2_/MRDRNA2_531246_c0_seq1.p1  ORF type:complete len:103 (+),score=15.24 gnl/MRDRNA2_/MRDRNA2_531246_c0_seq1:65-373(+)
MQEKKERTQFRAFIMFSPLSISRECSVMKWTSISSHMQAQTSMITMAEGRRTPAVLHARDGLKVYCSDSRLAPEPAAICSRSIDPCASFDHTMTASNKKTVP